MRSTALAALILSALALAQPAPPPSPRHHARALLEARQQGLDGAENLAGVNSTVSSTSSADARESVSPTSSASTAAISSISSTIAPTSSAEPTSSSDTSTSAPPTSSAAGSPSGFLGDSLPSSSSPSFAPTTSSPTLPSASSVSLDDLSKTVTLVSSSSVKTTSSVSGLPSTSADAAKSHNDEKIGGLPKTTFIIIIAVASGVVLIALAWTAFRKWKLRPSRRFDSRMKPVNFDPQGMGGGDDFLEKTLKRSPSHSSLDRQRQQFIADLDKAGPDYVEGVPQHDFTAGAEYDDDLYNDDPFAHSAAYDYDTAYYHQAIAQPAPALHGYPSTHDYPTQDHPAEGYNDLQRGNSGSSHGSGRGGHVAPSDFPMPDQYIGRPTDGDGPYAQASRYRY